MKKYRSKTIAAVLLSCFLLFTAGLSYTQELGAQPANTASEVLRDTLPNGLRVIIVPDTLAPVATMMLNYQVGANEAPPGFPGTAHALEHMMFRGNDKLSADQLSAITAAMGGNFNANTQQTVTQYFFTVPAEDLEVALRIGSIRMQGIQTSEALWEKERGAIEQEVARDLSNPQYILYTRLREALFKGTVYAHDALGTKESFQKTTAAMLSSFYKKWYVPNNAILVVTGDVDPQKVLTRVRTYFGGIASGKLPQRPDVAFQPVQPETLNLDTDLPYSLAVVAFRLPGTDNPDFAATRVLADALSSRRGDLYALVPEGKALYAGFSLNEMPAASLGFALAAVPGNGDVSAVADELKSILTQKARNGIQPDLVQAAQRREIANAEFQKNSVSDLASLWSQAVAVEGLDSPQERINAIANVTVDEVNKVARQQLDLNHAITAILTPNAAGTPTTGGSYGGPESFSPEHVNPVQLPDWAARKLNQLSLPKTNIRPEVTTLPNGIQLIVQPESISDTVTLYGHIENQPDLEIPQGQEGVDRVLDQLFSYGTTSMDRVAYQKALDEIAADVSAGTDFSLQVLSSHVERGMELLADQQLHPAFNEQNFTTVRRQQASATAGRLQSPDYRSLRALLSGLLPQNDPSLREPTPETINSLTLDNVENYYNKVYRPDMTTIVIIGKIEPDQAKQLVEKYFGQWTAAGPKPDTLLPEVPSNTSVSTHVANPSRVQVRVTLAQTLGIDRNSADYYPLQLGNHILGGAFYATRLYRDLRETSGLVYTVSSSLQVGRTRGFYIIEYGSDPANVNRAFEIIKSNLSRMRQTPVSDTELQQARALLLRQIPLAESSVDSIASGFLDWVRYDLPLDEPMIAARQYLNMTAQDVQKAFTAHVRPEDLVMVTEGPLPEK